MALFGGARVGSPSRRRELFCYDPASLSIGTASLLALVGLVALTLGADGLVRGASRLATHFGVSPLLVGLTVVAYGTSLPEIVASAVAAVEGHGAVTVGNVLGSNVANMGLILGGTALVTPLIVTPSVRRRELPLMVAATLGLALLAFFHELGRATGALFLALLVLVNVLSLRWARGSRVVPELDDEARRNGALGKNLGWTAGGLVLLLGGAHLLVESAVSLARIVGLSDFVIGVTLVAVGTSLPELATSFVAGLRKEADLVVGNIVGSNLFNILGALGVSATLRPLPIDPALLRFEMPALVVITLAMAWFLSTGRRVERWEGALLLAAYALFIARVL